MANIDPIKQALFNNHIKPALDNIAHDVDGYITKVDYYAQTAEVFYIDRQQRRQTISDLNLPTDANGVYRQSLYPGDKVRIAFRSGSHREPYISMTYKFSSQNDYFSKKGASIPRGIGYM